MYPSAWISVTPMFLLNKGSGYFDLFGFTETRLLCPFYLLRCVCTGRTILFFFFVFYFDPCVLPWVALFSYFEFYWPLSCYVIHLFYSRFTLLFVFYLSFYLSFTSAFAMTSLLSIFRITSVIFSSLHLLPLNLLNALFDLAKFIIFFLHF